VILFLGVASGPGYHFNLLQETGKRISVLSLTRAWPMMMTLSSNTSAGLQRKSFSRELSGVEVRGKRLQQDSKPVA